MRKTGLFAVAAALILAGVGLSVRVTAEERQQ